MKRLDLVYQFIVEQCDEQYRQKGTIVGVPTELVAQTLAIQRSNASSDLNALVKLNKLEKVEGKPVLYKIREALRQEHTAEVTGTVLDQIIGAEQSLKKPLLQAKAAVMYPPFGLHMLLLGETGVGKSMFAGAIFQYAQDTGRLSPHAPFVVFNCADYAHNPQLLLSQLFGVKKGSYTGAERDTAGLVEKADTGILFLDEVHRLPPEGQEMLFYLIDKGAYRALGEAVEERRVRVLIICATTESAESSLLRTFMRRIPMLITLPSIRERTMEERWRLIQSFFKNEAQALHLPVSVSKNALIAFLLYECPNNIGQLKSDIKLSCARAFLEYVGSREKTLTVCSEDLSEYIRRGFVNYKAHRQDIEQIGITGSLIFFPGPGENRTVGNEPAGIYEVLEQKFNTLKEKGLSDQDIQLIMSLEIDVYVKQYMSKFRKNNLEELYKIVDRKVVGMTQEFLQYVQAETGKPFEEKVLFGMSIHIAHALERIRDGKEIVNPHLSEIESSYPEEFALAQHFAKLAEREFSVIIPNDELGFITMFLVLDDPLRQAAPGRVGVIVAMHGNSTATSMVEVVNRLLGEKHAVGYDLPLEQKPEVALEEIICLVKEQDKGQGVLLLVDMGSLVMFGDIIYERTGIAIKTVEMATTPLVLEAARKALLMTSLEEIYYSLTNISPYLGRMYWNSVEFSHRLNEGVIVTACITGRGTAIKLKNILKKSLADYDRPVDILPIEIGGMEDYLRKLNKIRQEKNLLAVVSSIRPQDPSIPYLSTKELLEGKIGTVLQGLQPSAVTVPVLDNIQFMVEVIDEHLTIDGATFIRAYEFFVKRLAANALLLPDDADIGLILHLACTIERLLRGEALDDDGKHSGLAMAGYGESLRVVEQALGVMEETFAVKLPVHECRNIVKLIYLI